MAETIDFIIGDVKTTAFMGLPKGKGPHPGVVVSFHKCGLDEATAHYVDILATAGYGAIAPNHYHVLPPGVDPEERRKYLTDEQYELDFRAAADWLVAHGIDRGRLAILGHCAGGRSTWVGLESCPDLWRCGCVWYGGSGFRRMGALPPPYERLKLIACPVAGFFGNRDKNPSPDDVDTFDQALTKLGLPHEFRRYDADHAFANPMDKRYDEKATKDSWDRALAFLGAHCD